MRPTIDGTLYVCNIWLVNISLSCIKAVEFTKGNRRRAQTHEREREHITIKQFLRKKKSNYTYIWCANVYGVLMT